MSPILALRTPLALLQITKIMTDLQTEARRINSTSSNSKEQVEAATADEEEESAAAAGAKRGRRHQRQEQQTGLEGRLDKKQLAAHVTGLR